MLHKLSCLICVVVFSGCIAFGYETSKDFAAKGYLGLKVGHTQADTFLKVLDLQKSEFIGQLKLMERITSRDVYRNFPSSIADLDRAIAVNTWILNLKEDCNCWLLLRFENGYLRTLERKEWHGPSDY